jgi:hypothetical protein
LESQARHVSLQASKFLLLAGVQFWNCSLHVSLHDFCASWMLSIGRELPKARDGAGDVTSACAAKRPTQAMPTTPNVSTKVCFNMIDPAQHLSGLNRTGRAYRASKGGAIAFRAQPIVRSALSG